MRILILATFVVSPAVSQTKQCWVEIDHQNGWVQVEAYADSDAWREGRYFVKVDLAANGNASTSIQAGDFAVRDMVDPILSQVQLYLSEAGRLDVSLTVSDNSGRSCNDVVSY